MTNKEESKLSSDDETNDPNKDASKEEDSAMIEQFVNSLEATDSTKCILNIKKGAVLIGNCKIDFEGTNNNKDETFPCVLGQADTSLIVESSTIKGDSLHEANTIGIYLDQPNNI